MKQPSAAIREFEAALADNRDDAQAHANFAVVLRETASETGRGKNARLPCD